MGQAEYIVRFKGDYSALKKDLEKIDIATKKLEDDEVIIKLHYDGNVKEFNKVFDQMSKMHPELDIQFQYNVNQKMLEQEMDKLQKLSQIKLDVDEDNALIKINKMIDNIELSLQKGLPKEKIQDQLREVFGYYNTAVKSGAKNLDFDNISDRIYRIFDLKGSEFRKIFDDMFDQNATKPIKLFEFDDSVDNELKKTKDRITDIEDTLAGLEKRGASKSGLPSDLQKLQDEIKILRSNIGDMQEQLKDLSGEAFNNMTEQIKLTNEQLNYSLEALTKLKKILSSNGLEINNSVGGVIKQWQDEEETKIGERYTAFNTKTKKTSGAHLVADAEGTSMKLIRSAIDEMGSEAEGTIHSHPMKYAAFSDNDIEMYFKLLKDSQEKIWSHAVTSAEQAISIDMTKVDTSKEEDILKEIRDSYSEIDEKIKGEMGERTADIKNRIISVLDGIESESPLINEMTANIKNGLDEMFKKLGDSYSLTDYQDAFDDLEFDAVNKVAKKYASSMKVDVGALEKKLAAAYTPVLGEIENSIFDSINDQAQQSYQEVLKKVFTNPEFLKSGETSAIKIEALTDFIDWGSIEDSATKATQKAADAIKKAQDSNSPAELTKPLGQNFTEGYAEGIREAIPEVVKACKEVVLAAYNAIKEAKTSEDGESVDFSEGFINSFKESLNNSLPDIQEKIKEIFSKLDINEEAYSNFETIGQNIVNSVISGINEHSQESLSDALERIINDAFTNIILNSAVQELIEKMQRAMDYYLGNTPLQISHFDVETDSIIVSIQNALDNKTFNVDLSGYIQNIATALNTSADNVRSTFLDAVRWMREADKWQNEQGSVGARERKLYYNTKTGEFSNPSIIGGDHSTPAFLDMVADYKSKGTIFDTSLHTHLYDDYAFPSSLGNAAGGGSGDIDIWFKNAYSSLYGGIYETISKFVVGAQKEYVEFDFSKIASNAEELENFLVNWIKENFEKVEEVLGEDALDYELNPRKVAGLYVGKKLIKLAHEKESDSSFTPYNDVEELFESMFRQYEDKGWLESQVTGELSTFREIFDERAPLKFGPGINLFDSMPDLLNEALDKIVTKIRTWITQAADFGENIGMTTIKDAIDNALSTTLVDDKFSEIRDFQEIIKRGFTSYFKDEFTQGRFSIDGIQSWDEAGSVALHELIDTDDLIGKIVRYYTPDEFEKNFGAKLPSNFRPIKQYNTRDFMKWGVDDQGNHLRNGLSFDNLDSDEIIEWKKRLLQYFPELIESQAEELYNFMKSDYGNDFGFDEHFIAKINGYVAQNARQQQSDISQTQLPFSPILPEDFQTQLQNAIEESGKYLIKVYGELIDGFKSQLQQDIDEIGYLFVELKGRLSDDFKEALQSAIDSLGAIPIEVKPYVRKGSEIEEVDLPGGNQNNLLSDSKETEIEAETKAYVKKSDAIEQLRSNIANLKKVEADKLINENFSKNEKGRFQIEQTALDELIASLKEKKQIEESTTPTTSSVADNIQSEVATVNQAIETEKKKFDELKNKISKTIPNAIETKNKAFEKEGNLVAKIVDDEITYFEVLKDSVDNVTDSIGKQQNSVKDLKPKSKSNNSKKLEDTTNEIDKEALLRQHNTELFRNYAQSIGQKSQIQQDMSAYYAQLEKDSAKAYSDAEKKANSLLGKVKKLQNSNKYTQDFVEKLNSAENELTNFLKELSKGTISFDEVDSRVKILSENIENTLSKKAFGSVKQAAEKSLTNVGLKIDQIIAKNSAMGKDFESRFKALRRSLESKTTIEGVQKIIAEVNKLESELIATGNTGKSFIDQIKQRLRDINSKYIAQYFSFQDIIRYARQAATNVIQLNDAFIELSKVSNTSLETLERDFQSYADIAHDIGGTISDTINATADWARMGMINAPLYGDI